MPVWMMSPPTLNHAAHRTEELLGGLLHFAQTVMAEANRIHVELKVEACELRNDSVIGIGLQHLVDNRGGFTALVDKEQLLLGSNAPNAFLKHVLAEHVLKRSYVLDKMLREFTQGRFIGVLLDVVLAHSGSGSSIEGESERTTSRISQDDVLIR
jgi:hypothetical protein